MLTCGCVCVLHTFSLEWRYNERVGVSNHQPHDCLLNRLFRRRSKKTSTLRVTGLCAGNSPVTGEFPEQRASNAEQCFHPCWRHHVNATYVVKIQEVYPNKTTEEPLVLVAERKSAKKASFFYRPLLPTTGRHSTEQMSRRSPSNLEVSEHPIPQVIARYRRSF